MRSARSASAVRQGVVVPFNQAKGRDAQELAFLPAALEIVESPPSPIGRAIGMTIVLLFGAALAWTGSGGEAPPPAR